MRVSIIIPAYNEEEAIGRILEEYCSYLRKQRAGFEVLVVINNTNDGTERIIKEYQKKYPEIRYLNLREGGKGFAIIEGFKDALKRKNNDLIGFVDADLSTSAKEYYKLIRQLGSYEGIIASRWLKGAKQNYSFTRKVTSRGFNFIVRSLFLFPYRDTQCGAKVFKRHAIESIAEEIKITRWAFDVELLYRIRKKNYRVKEIPTCWEEKLRKSKLDLRIVPLQMFSAMVRLRLLNSPFKFVVRFYDKMPESLKIHHRR
ncbi:MAG: glycosyltransferase [archaeon]